MHITAISAACLALVGISMATEVEAAIRRTTTIQAQGLAPALETLAKQRGFQILYVTSVVNGLRTDGAVGEFTDVEAIEKLLSGTGLTYRYVDDMTVIVTSAAATVPVFTSAAGASESEPMDRAHSETIPDSTNSQDTENNGRKQGAEEIPSGVSEDRTREIRSETTQLNEILVTGTHIRGTPLLAPVLTFSSLEIQQTGFATTQDWLDTLPQNVGGNPSEELGGIGNFNRGTAINLRGLGAGSTLVLINGRRQPTSGLEGSFVDISSIPTAAIDRIEVLTDGASAIYGSDAIGGVVNFVLKKDYEGAETRARYATTDRGAEEITASQLFGTAWSTGSALFHYQYYDRKSLRAGDRDFSSNADKTPFGGDDFRIINSNPGNIFGFDGILYAIPNGQDGTDLAADQLIAGTPNRQNQLEGIDLLPTREMHSAFFSAEQRIGERWVAFFDGRYSKRDTIARTAALTEVLAVPSSNPFFVSPTPDIPVVLVAYNFGDDFGVPLSKGETETYVASGGARVALARDWQMQLTGSHGAEELAFLTPTLDQGALQVALADANPATAFNPFGDGTNTSPQTLATLLAFQREEGQSKLNDLNLLADGPIFALGGGPSKLAAGANFRREELETGIDTQLQLDRDVTAAFFELALPFVSARNSRKGLYGFDVLIAGRYEDYSDFGDTFNPKFSLRYEPIEMVSVHGTWGTSFKAPSIFDLEDRSPANNFIFQFPIADPQSSAGFTDALIRFGGNSSLEEETADTWTAGVTLTPRPDTQLTLKYYNINYRDRIAVPGPADSLSVLLEENTWSTIITRNPSQQLIESLCNDPLFIGDPSACVASSPPVIVDLRKQNIARTEIDGVDLTLSQSYPTQLGTFGLELNGTYVLNYDISVSDNAPRRDLLNSINNPVDLRVRAVATWIRNSITASVGVNHTAGYDDDTLASSRSIDSWNTVDVRVSYTTVSGSRWSNGVEVSLSVTNLLDEDPPFVNRASGYDAANASPLGRFIGLELTKSWGN